MTPPQKIPDRPTHLFDIVPPLGYKVAAVCGVGHPVAFRHSQTGGEYIPFTVDNKIVCTICLAPVVGLTCARNHMSFEVEDV